MFAHFVGTESLETWRSVFEAWGDLEGYDFPCLVCVVVQEKSIDTNCKENFTQVSVFLDKHHVVKNTSPELGTKRFAGIRSYERALRAPKTVSVDSIKEKYGLKTSAYLSKFTDKELYRAYSLIEDLVVTPQGAKSAMFAALWKQN